MSLLTNSPTHPYLALPLCSSLVYSTLLYTPLLCSPLLSLHPRSRTISASPQREEEEEEDNAITLFHSTLPLFQLAWVMAADGRPRERSRRAPGAELFDLVSFEFRVFGGVGAVGDGRRETGSAEREMSGDALEAVVSSLRYGRGLRGGGLCMVEFWLVLR